MLDWPQVYAHVDMDAFFVAVELQERPDLRDRPVAVANGDRNSRGVIAAASYPARRFGVHSALPLRTAFRRCPDLVLVPVRMDRYREASERVMDVLRRFSESVEVLGLDEAYVDLSDSPAPRARGRRIKTEVREETELECSVGIGPAKLLAKIASTLEKPDGFVVLGRERMLEVVGDRPARLIPGVGPKTEARLHAAGVSTVLDLATSPVEQLAGAVGERRAAELRALANGIDERAVVPTRERKSESCERTFPADVDDPEELRRVVGQLSERIGERVLQDGYSFRTVTLKIRLRPFRTHTRSRTLPCATHDPDVIGLLARELLEDFSRDAPVRLLGVGVAGLSRTEEEAAAPVQSTLPF